MLLEIEVNLKITVKKSRIIGSIGSLTFGHSICEHRVKNPLGLLKSGEHDVF